MRRSTPAGNVSLEVKVLTDTSPGQGHDSPYCGAPKRDKKRGGTGDPCERPAGWGTKHPGIGCCKLHGGNTENHNKHATKQQAAEAVRTFGLAREVDPRDALLEEVYRTAGAVDWLHKQVQALTPDDVIWGQTEQVARDSGEFPGVDTTYAATAHAWVQLWQKERKHLIDVCKAAVAAGIEERRVRLAEQQGALLSDAIKRILADLELTQEQQAKAPEVVVRHLRAVAGGMAG